MATRPLPEVPEELIGYLRSVFPDTGLKQLKVNGAVVGWEDPMDAAARRGVQNTIDYLIMLRELQLNPDTEEATLNTLVVEIDEGTGQVVGVPRDGYVLRVGR